jgi:hypothetical protein
MVYMKKSKILVFSPGNMSVNFPSILFTIDRLNQLLFSLMNERSRHTEINNNSLFSGYPVKPFRASYPSKTFNLPDLKSET